MIIDLSDKVIVITGASKGIGYNMAKTFAKEKANVVINYNNSEDRAIELYNDICSFNSNCMLVKADITKPKEVFEMYRQVLNKYQHVDVLINNAGICDDELLPLMSYEKFKKVVDVNLFGTFLCSRIFSRMMIRQKQGKIINVASIKGLEGALGQSNYSSSKAAIIGLTKTNAKELCRYGISVNAVCPGYIKTDLNRVNCKKELIAKERSALNYEHGLQDLLDFLVYIVSDKCRNISGRVFVLDSRIL